MHARFARLVLTIFLTGVLVNGEAGSATGAPFVSDVAFSVLTQGPFGLCETPCYYAIADAGQWLNFWHLQMEGSSPEPLLPQIDFRHHTVVVIGMGWVSSSGYTIGVAGVTLGRKLLTIHVQQDAPTDGVNWHLERPYQVVDVAAKATSVNFVVSYRSFCASNENAFCGVAPWNHPIALGGVCTPPPPQDQRIRATCYSPAQRPVAEHALPIKPFNPSQVISHRTNLRLHRLIVMTRTTIWSNNQYDEIHYIYGALPPPMLVPISHGGKSGVIPIFKISWKPQFVEVVESMVTPPPQGTWLQQNSASFTRSDTRRTFQWYGPWQFITEIRSNITLVVRSYMPPAVLRLLGQEIRAKTTATNDSYPRGRGP